MTSLQNHNVNQFQVDVFQKFVEKWWDITGPIKGLHKFNEIRVPYVVNGLLKTYPEKVSDDPKKPLKNFTILDIGCGGGILTEALAREGCEIVGLDAGKELIEMSARHAKLDKEIDNLISYVHSTVEAFCVENAGRFDAVVMSEVIEHVPEKDSFMKSCISCLKPGGSMFITTFNRTWAAWLYGIIIAEDVFKVIPKGSHDYQLFVSPEGVEEIAKHYDCRTVDVVGISFNVVNWDWFLTRHRQICYGMHLVKAK